MSAGLSVRGHRIGGRVAWQGGHVVVETADGRTVELGARALGGGEWLMSGPDGARRVVIARRGTAVWVHCEGRTILFEEESFAGRQAHAAAGDGRLVAPMPCSVLEVLVAEGSRVEEGQTLVVVSAMKMQVDIKTPAAGVVRGLPVAPGDQVDAGALLAEVEAFPGDET